MTLALFYSTLLVLLLSIFASALCLSSFLVTHRRAMVYACASFLSYFLDVALVLQDDFTRYGVGAPTPSPDYDMIRLAASAITATGFLGPLWLIACEYTEVKRSALRYGPCVAFAVISLLTIAFTAPGSIQDFIVYTYRSVFLLWMVAFGAWNCMTSKNTTKRKHLARFKWLSIAIALLALLIIAKDVVAYFGVGPQVIQDIAALVPPARNPFENLLMLLIMAAIARSAVRGLMARFDRPACNPGSDRQREDLVDENLAVFSSRFSLSNREQEVLRLVLLGADTANIASTLHLAPSTVKVHVHNILRKTGKANRQELITDFWKS